MEVNVSQSDKVTTVGLEGTLDGKTVPLVQEKIIGLLGPQPRLLLDMSQVEFMSSAGLRMLLSLQRRLGDDGKLVLTGLSEQISNTMKVTGFLNFFTILPEATDGTLLLNRA